MRITKISVKDYKGFPGEYEFALGEPGKNLLIYGENGSGKSSLFHALDQFFRASRSKISIESHKNIFVEEPESYVKLEILDFNDDGSRDEMSGIYEWSVESTPERNELIKEASKTYGCIDYRSLLNTHFIHQGKVHVNIFKLLVESLIAYQQNPITKKMFTDEWQKITHMKGSKLTPRERDEITGMLNNFDKGLKNYIRDIKEKANELLTFFDHNIKIDLVSEKEASISFKPKNFIPPEVMLKVSYAEKLIKSHHAFLNEARLSSIAISIYLASLLLNPESRLKIILLDDVLIGLDMANRMPVLKILKKHFSEWQIIILTHDRIWYDMIRMQTKDSEWVYYEMFCEKDVSIGFDRPYHRAKGKGWQDLLNIAKKHLKNHDERAAAVYARAAFEHKIKKYCEKKKIKVQYKIDPRNVTADSLWQAIIRKLKDDDKEADLRSTIDDIETYRKIIFNPLSHESATPVTKAEIEGAISAVAALSNLP